MAGPIVFWTALAVIAYAYAGFPCLVAGLAALRPRPRVRQAPVTPRVSMIIAAHDEADVIAARLDNAIAMDYPRHALEVIVASDGSTDATAAIAERHAADGVRVLRLPRAGKIAALNAAARVSTGDVLVFSDANTRVEPQALRALVRNFADPAVGGVVGHTGYAVPTEGESSGLGELLYWRYDTWLKERESRAGSVVSAHGGLHAVRRELYSPPPDGAVTDDFAISTGVIAAGRRLVFERDARAWEDTATKSGQEYARRVRLMTRGLRAVAYRRALLNPFRHGAYAIVLFSHKVVRRLVPFALIALLAGSLAAAPASPLYRAAAGAQLAFYLLAGVGWLARSSRLGRARLLHIPFFLCMANAAALVAWLRFARGDRIALWQPQRSIPTTDGA